MGRKRRGSRVRVRSLTKLSRNARFDRALEPDPKIEHLWWVMGFCPRRRIGWKLARLMTRCRCSTQPKFNGRYLGGEGTPDIHAARVGRPQRSLGLSACPTAVRPTPAVRLPGYRERQLPRIRRSLATHCCRPALSIAAVRPIPISAKRNPSERPLASQPSLSEADKGSLFPASLFKFRHHQYSGKN
jgi:hypothetical protein